MNILITSAGQRVSLVRAFQKELKKIYPDGMVYTVDLNPSKYAFNHLNLDKVYSYHHDDNTSMIKINKKLGGKIDGVLRKDLYLPNGVVRDRVVMSILKDEFNEVV